jgi:hypothetical protein
VCVEVTRALQLSCIHIAVQYINRDLRSMGSSSNSFLFYATHTITTHLSVIFTITIAMVYKVIYVNT